uniref:Ani s 9 allergen n=2 Tax=Anisakis simplex complex TaxID=644710 RepID=B2XCP1_ANISI|nr:Ani s 9 allergen precursor [Anisakis simplex]AGC60038.1 Ani s 9 allergen [Anisakis pegreffii]AGC60039.1 Ani s 9 allergen [Anisakis pegreffii]AGC60040.1 Ani s 9 allergen [Anisakis pegreffii]AGE13348.1 Ani s 9 allergen precursor [Anisakis simplex]
MKLCILAVAVFVVAVSAQGPPPLPPFVANAPPAVQAEFRQLANGAPDKTEAEIEAQIEQWVASKGGAVQAEFNKFKQMLEQGKARAEAAHQASLTRLSPAAKAADARLSAIASNRALKVGEKQRQLAAAFQALDPAVKAELQKEMQG